MKKQTENHFDPNQNYQDFVHACQTFEDVKTAVVYPCSDGSLKGAIEGAKESLIAPILIGPQKRIHHLADEHELDISHFKLINIEKPEQASYKAVDMVRAGEAEAIMKGSLHTDDLLRPIISKTKGLRTDRRITHAFVMAVSTYHKPFIVTDAAVNIYPDLMTKKDIIQNAIDLMHTFLELALDGKQDEASRDPKVAILSAVETINPTIQSTIEAAALCKMADRKQITGGILDGPLAFDNAISLDAAKTKGIESRVAGDADILVAPDLEAGNMLAKQLMYLTDATSAGIILGARCPIMLTSRADGVRSRVGSCAIAALIAESKRKAALLSQ